MRVVKVFTVPFRVVTAPFRAVGNLRASRNEKSANKAAALSQLRFSRMSDRDQREVERVRSRFGD